MPATFAGMAGRIGGLDDVLVEAGSSFPALTSQNDLFGYDVIAQFSRGLLQAQVARSLAARGISRLSAYVPWGSVEVPASLTAAMAPAFLQSLAVRPARLELRLLAPWVAGLRWPPELVAEPPGGTISTARLAAFDRHVDIGWRVEVNVQVFRPPVSETSSGDGPGGAGAGGGSGSAGAGGSRFGDLGSVLGTVESIEIGPSRPPVDDPSWPRSTIAAGAAVTAAVATVSVDSRFWRFGAELDFSDAEAGSLSGDAGVTEFLATEAGRQLLASAIAPLKAAQAVHLCPPVVPGGALSARSVQQMGVPAFHVRDLLLQDTAGQPVLCLAAELGATGRGVASLVRPFLDGGDFGYGVSERVLRPALAKRWSLAVSGLSLVNDVPVDMPIHGDSGPTAPGRARIRVTFGPVLDDVAIVPSTDRNGDPLRLLGRQTVKLLALWRPGGEQIEDLGDLAKPEEAGFALPMRLFDFSGPSPSGFQANFRDVILTLMGTVMLPLAEGFPVAVDSINGFASSALKSIVVKWRLRPPRIIDVGGVVTGELVEVLR